MTRSNKFSLKEEINKEVIEIENELAAHPELDELEVTDEMDLALLARIQAYEDEKQKVEEERHVPPEECENITPMPKRTYRKKYGRRAVFALAAAVVLVMAMGTTTMGSKSYWKTLMDRLVGKKQVEMTNVEDMKSYEIEAYTEGDAYQAINNIMGQRIVQIAEKPKKMVFQSYSIDAGMKQAYIFYKYQGEMIRYAIYLNFEDSSKGVTKEDIKQGERELDVDGVVIKVEEFDVLNYEVNRLVASYEYEGVCYQIKGMISQEVMENILKGLIFKK